MGPRARRATNLVLPVLLFTMSLSGCIGDRGDSSTGRTSTAIPGPDGFPDTHVFPGNYTTEGPISRPLEPGPHDALNPSFVELQSPVDGGTIALEVHRPDVPDGRETPTIVDASSYYDTNWGGENDTYASEGLYSQALVRNFVPHGYTVVLLAVRGTADSDGCWDVLGPKGTADIDHVVDWLATRDWSNGNVGFVGLSQDGAGEGHAQLSGGGVDDALGPALAGLGFDTQDGSWGETFRYTPVQDLR